MHRPPSAPASADPAIGNHAWGRQRHEPVITHPGRPCRVRRLRRLLRRAEVVCKASTRARNRGVRENPPLPSAIDDDCASSLASSATRQCLCPHLDLSPPFQRDGGWESNTPPDLLLRVGDMSDEDRGRCGPRRLQLEEAVAALRARDREKLEELLDEGLVWNLRFVTRRRISGGSGGEPPRPAAGDTRHLGCVTSKAFAGGAANGPTCNDRSRSPLAECPESELERRGRRG